MRKKCAKMRKKCAKKCAKNALPWIFSQKNSGAPCKYKDAISLQNSPKLIKNVPFLLQNSKIHQFWPQNPQFFFGFWRFTKKNAFAKAFPLPQPSFRCCSCECLVKVLIMVTVLIDMWPPIPSLKPLML